MTRILSRLQQTDLGSRVKPESLVAALAPVPDKPYLECVARLPQPGLSRPPSSLKEGKRKTSSRKGAKKSKK